ncbi:ABC transporter permease [Ewingella sp. S1.OA.A_B6]
MRPDKLYARLSHSLLIFAVIAIFFLWFIVPLALTALWSLVDIQHPWAWPNVLPPMLSLRRWNEVWNTTALPQALTNSYLLAPGVALCTLLLASPAAYAFGRLNFYGKGVAQMLVLIPLVIPGFVVAVFFASLLIHLGIHSRYLAIMISHTVIFLPYAVRILTLSFTLVRQDVIDAARDLSASRLTCFRTAYLPVIRPGLFASLIVVFILSIEEFALSYIIGSPDFTTVPTILYSYLGYNFIRPNAAVVSLTLIVPNVLMMLFAERLMLSNPLAQVSSKG